MRVGLCFEVGDGHAATGNGEVDLTAMETSLTGVFQFIVRKDMHLNWPRAETLYHWITMGLDVDLTEATKLALHEALDFLVNEKRLTREDAYMLASVAVDFEITQLVDGTKGVHALIPKAIFRDRKKCVSRRWCGKINAPQFPLVMSRRCRPSVSSYVTRSRNPGQPVNRRHSG